MAKEEGSADIGVRLRAARERKGLTVLQSAEKLHMDARLLEALEAGDFASLGADVYVLMTLPDDTQRYPIAGKVAWVTPARAAGNRTQGVGVRFPNDEKSRLLKLKIEEILGAHLASERPTQTI